MERVNFGMRYPRRFQRLTLQPQKEVKDGVVSHAEQMRIRIIKRAASEFRDGMYGILSVVFNPLALLSSHVVKCSMLIKPLAFGFLLLFHFGFGFLRSYLDLSN